MVVLVLGKIIIFGRVKYIYLIPCGVFLYSVLGKFILKMSLVFSLCLLFSKYPFYMYSMYVVNIVYCFCIVAMSDNQSEG